MLIRYYSGDDLVRLISDPSVLFDRRGDAMFMAGLSAILGKLLPKWIASAPVAATALQHHFFIKSSAEKAYYAKCGLKAIIGFSPNSDLEMELNSLEQVSPEDTKAYDSGAKEL